MQTSLARWRWFDIITCTQLVNPYWKFFEEIIRKIMFEFMPSTVCKIFPAQVKFYTGIECTIMDYLQCPTVILDLRKQTCYTLIQNASVHHKYPLKSAPCLEQNISYYIKKEEKARSFLYPLVVSSDITGGGGGRGQSAPRAPETSDREIFTDVSGKKRKRG